LETYDSNVFVGGGFTQAGGKPSASVASWTKQQPCDVTMTGDVNQSVSITSGDLVFLVNYVFKGGPSPLPCVAVGDVDCTGEVTSADIIGLVNFVFKSGPAPCNVCALVPLTWSCP
jgi:hypothetical protein